MVRSIQRVSWSEDNWRMFSRELGIVDAGEREERMRCWNLICRTKGLITVAYAGCSRHTDR